MSEQLHLSGIVPLTGRGQLDLAHHNQVVGDFRETFVKPLARDLGVRVLDRSVSAQPSLEEVLSTQAMARLRDFAAAANKYTLHELDLRRSAGFIGQTHLDGTVVDPDLLDAWLAGGGFQTSQGDALIREFDSGRRLLKWNQNITGVRKKPDEFLARIDAIVGYPYQAARFAGTVLPVYHQIGDAGVQLQFYGSLVSALPQVRI